MKRIKQAIEILFSPYRVDIEGKTFFLQKKVFGLLLSISNERDELKMKGSKK